MRNKRKTLQRLKKTQQAINKFFKSILKNYEQMKKNIKSIWAVCICFIIAMCAHSCNVTRTIKTESSYFQKGDTTCTITVKTVETYDATKKGM